MIKTEAGQKNNKGQHVYQKSKKLREKQKNVSQKEQKVWGTS